MRRRNAFVSTIKVVRSPRHPSLGSVHIGAIVIPCALGRAGLQIKWREGDGRTPLGNFALRHVHFRCDRLRRPATTLPIRRLLPGDWWNDRVSEPHYNRLIRLRPPPADSEERLCRPDALYDLIIEIGFNDAPVVRGKGSGIFWHVARENFLPTAGCVATRRADLLRALPYIGPNTRIILGSFR